MRALVLEDSPTVRKVLCHYLREMGIEVVEASDGREGFERLNEMPRPDLVLVDWDMPVMSGIDFVRAVRDLRSYDALPLIMVTSRSESEDLAAAMAAGADAYIQKPCTLDAIREKLDELGVLKG